MISDSAIVEGDLSSSLSAVGVTAYYYGPTVEGSQAFEINHSGRYVRVQLNGDANPLSLAEVQVLATSYVESPEPTPTPSVSPSPIATPEPTPVNTPTPSPVTTPVITPSPAATPVSVETPAPVITPTPVATPIVEVTPVTVTTPSPSPAPTLTLDMVDLENGEERYTALCAGCHGEQGDGTFAINVANFTGLSELALYNELEMPFNNEGACVDACAKDVSGYIYNGFTASLGNSPAPSPSPTPTPAITPSPSATPISSADDVDCSDMQALMSEPELGCTNAGCHSASPSQAAQIALTGSIDDVALRLGNVDSVSNNCAGEKVIDFFDPSNSLLLKLIDPNSGDQCAQKMPLGANGVSEAHFACFEEWIDDIVSLSDLPDEPVGETFVPADVLTSVNKVKVLLHGGAVTETELNSAGGNSNILDREVLKDLIRDWMETEAFETKFKTFLSLSLQQTNINSDLIYRQQFNNITSGAEIDAVAYISSFEESFVRTAFRIVDENQDFRRVATTTEWDITRAILLALSYADYENRYPFRDDSNNIIRLRDFAYLCGDAENEAGCDNVNDYNDWRQVNLTQGTSPANFEFTQSMAESIRNVGPGDDFPLLATRVGFFTTPVFFQSWESNVGNQFRVTINQALIAGLGLSFEAGDVTPSGDLTALDEDHAGEDNPECYACHRLMDPMRQIYDNTYDVTRSRALESAKSVPSSFHFHGFEKDLSTIYDLGQAIFDHPNFAKAWVGKLCNWATSASCDDTDPEFLRLVDVFKNSGYQMKELVVELFSSPLVTVSEYTDSFELGAPDVVLSRANHFCHSMHIRLNEVRKASGLPSSSRANLCEVNYGTTQKAALIPRDEFARGNIDLIQAVNVDPFLTSGFRQLCETASNQVVGFGVGVEGNTNYDKFFESSLQNIDESIDLMVQFIMGIPPNTSLYEKATNALRKVFDIHSNNTSCSDIGADVIDDNTAGISCGFNNNNGFSLQQVWQVACSAPSTMGMGF